MAQVNAANPRTRLLTTFAGVALGVLAVTVLYFAQSIFIPLALAVFFTFLMAPVVERLERWVGRAAAVVVTVLLAAALLGLVGWMVSRQVTGLVRTLEEPEYAGNIAAKVRHVKDWFQAGVVDEVKKFTAKVGEHARGARGEVQDKANPPPAEGPPAPAKPAAPAPPPAAAEPSAILADVTGTLGRAGEGLAQAALVAVLVVFMLLRREDLRNRVIRLIGHGRLTVTTMALDDAAARVSRFLFTQLVINVGYGLVFAAGLWFLGVPYAFLWGFLAAVMRYVPYVGIWLAILPPIALSLAVSPGWALPLWVVGLVAVLEVLAANVIEPVMFGQSIGVSEVALLVSAAFWAWLWGPLGLVLSAPLTVCLVVLGRYVPQLEFFDVILGDSPALPERLVFYQRLLARDQDEAATIVEKYTRTAPPEQAYDEFLIPALVAAKRDRDHRDLAEADERYIVAAVAETAEDLAASEPAPAPPAGAAAADRPRVLGCPARDAADELAVRMFGNVLDPARWDLEVLPVAALAAELLDRVAASGPAAVVIAALPPGGLSHTRYLCKRLRQRFPELKIAVSLWGWEGDLGHAREVLAPAGADHVGQTMLETRAQLTEWLPVFATAAEAEGAAAGERPKAKERVGGGV